MALPPLLKNAPVDINAPPATRSQGLMARQRYFTFAKTVTISALSRIHIGLYCSSASIIDMAKTRAAKSQISDVLKSAKIYFTLPTGAVKYCVLPQIYIS